MCVHAHACLYILIHPQVLVYAGDSPKCPKVAEYGGNTHGFGSRSVLGKGWPKDLVKVMKGEGWGDNCVMMMVMLCCYSRLTVIL